MKKTIFSLISISTICLGTMAKEANLSLKEIVEITITQNGSSYTTQAKWFEYNIDKPEQINALAKPEVSSLSGTWGVIKVVAKDPEFYETTKLMLDGKLIEFPNGYGTTFFSNVSPKDDGVYVKGVFSVTKKDSTFSIPFEGIFEVGKKTVIFEQTKHFGENAKSASQKPIDTEPFKPHEHTEDLFRK